MTQNTGQGLSETFGYWHDLKQIAAVDMGYQSIVTADEGYDGLYTLGVSVCSGVAVLSSGTPTIAGIMHVASRGDQLLGLNRPRQEMEIRVTQDAKEAVDNFVTRLVNKGGADRGFECVMFGSRGREQPLEGREAYYKGQLSNGDTIIFAEKLSSFLVYQAVHSAILACPLFPNPLVLDFPGEPQQALVDLKRQAIHIGNSSPEDFQRAMESGVLRRKSSKNYHTHDLHA